MTLRLIAQLRAVNLSGRLEAASPAAWGVCNRLLARPEHSQAAGPHQVQCVQLQSQLLPGRACHGDAVRAVHTGPHGHSCPAAGHLRHPVPKRHFRRLCQVSTWALCMVWAVSTVSLRAQRCKCVRHPGTLWLCSCGDGCRQQCLISCKWLGQPFCAGGRAAGCAGLDHMQQPFVDQAVLHACLHAC